MENSSTEKVVIAEETNTSIDNLKSPKEKTKANAKKGKTTGTRKGKAKSKATKSKQRVFVPNYPRHSIEQCLRIPKAIFNQNAGKAVSSSTAAKYLGIGDSGPFKLEISSCKKYGLLEATNNKLLRPTEIARSIIRPQNTDEQVATVQQIILKAPVVSSVYKHYRGEFIPDAQFLDNTLVDNFKFPREKLSDFKKILFDNLIYGKLLETVNEKKLVVDIIDQNHPDELAKSKDIVKGRSNQGSSNSNSSCFVMMPFGGHIGQYFDSIYKPAIEAAGLIAVRADDDIFGTGKIMDQIWTGITNSDILIADLTSRNPNVYYELGIAHALKKPVVLVSSNEDDVPFDLRHVRVIIYDYKDPFWGQKLVLKISENLQSAIVDPSDAILFR